MHRTLVDFICSKCQNSQKEKLFWTFLIYNPHLPNIMYAVSYQNWPSSTFKVLGVEQHILQFTSQTFHLAVNQLCIYFVVNTVVLKKRTAKLFILIKIQKINYMTKVMTFKVPVFYCLMRKFKLLNFYWNISSLILTNLDHTHRNLLKIIIKNFWYEFSDINFFMEQ